MKKVKVRGKFSSPAAGSDGQDDSGSDDVLFWINKSGFPISDHVWDRMFDHASKANPGAESTIYQIKSSRDSLAVPIPKSPLASNTSMNADKRVELVQNYMCELQYNHTGTQFFDIKKYRPMSCQSESAREMIKESLPIKCLEAVILGIYLTNGLAALERYPLSFRSVFGPNVHRHVVLVVSWNGLFGALGMSRRDDLMYKPLQFSSLSDLVINFIESYNQYRHKVNKLKIGFPVSHDPHSHEPIHWKGLAINPSTMKRTELQQAVDKHAKDIRAWVRQAPLGTTYVPKPQANGYSTPVYSQNSSTKHKPMETSQSMSDATANVAAERSSTSMSDRKTIKSTPRSSQALSNQHRRVGFEMRI